MAKKQPQPVARVCDKCGELRGDARLDAGTQKVLCNPCWFATQPADPNKSR
jgi:formylmethanofuran dehydrogenase subunit E